MASLDFTEDMDISANALSNKKQQCLSNPTHSRYIITLSTYKLIQTHSSFIKQLLTQNRYTSPLSYQIIPRSNTAIRQYPTDFIIINIMHRNSTTADNIVSLLQQSSEVKYINMDKIIHKKQPNKRHLLYSDDQHADYRSGGKLLSKMMPFEDELASTEHHRSLLGHFRITEHLGAKTLWDDGYDGKDVNVAVFDTGINEQHSHFNHIEERTNWTDEDQLDDGIGHGTFVSGIIASKYKECPGFAPNAILHTFRVFTNQQMSYTSWFLDAFNYAIFRKMNLLNLSIGGPDWLDIPFVDKVREMQANNVIMITACGNDGKYGTINNPADQLSVIGVGGITQNNAQIANFQSRGMTTWELPFGYGRVKPDIVTVGQSLYGSSMDGGCRTLSGTSVASPVVSGVAALLSSVIPADIRWDIINPASLKQILIESADRMDNVRLFEQGNGRINLQNAYKYIVDYKKHVSAVPASLDFTQCPHFWPFCRQPLYHSCEPYIFNLTLLNPFSVIGAIANPPHFEITSIIFANGTQLKREIVGEYIRMEFEYNTKLWPWCGWLGIYIFAEAQTQNLNIVALSGRIKVDINVVDAQQLHSLYIPFSLQIIPTPPSKLRLLWDQYHNLQYPLAYFPRDDLEKDGDMLDWFGDHLHTNYHKLYDFLRDKGYFVEVLRSDYSCIDPQLYSTLIIVDTEDKFDAKEIDKLQFDILNNDLSIIIFADWYNEKLQDDVRFFDDNTRSLWDALSGGANVVAMNELLEVFGIQFGDMVSVGDIKINKYETYFQTGSIIRKSGLNSYVLLCDLFRLISSKKSGKKDSRKYKVVPLVLYDAKYAINAGEKAGRISVFGDSTCLDANQYRKNCFWLMEMLLKYACFEEMDKDLQGKLVQITNENINEIFSENYLSMMNVPKINKKIEPLFNAISRVQNMETLKCGIENVENMQTQKKQLNSVTDNVVAIDNKMENKQRNKLVVQMQPHLYGDDINQYDIMLFYPFMIVVLFIFVICLFCRPIQKLFFCDKIISKMKHNLQMKMKLIDNNNKEKQANLHYHV